VINKKDVVSQPFHEHYSETTSSSRNVPEGTAFYTTSNAYRKRNEGGREGGREGRSTTS